MENLIEKKVTVYLDGGWRIYGKVEDMNNKIIVISNEGKEYVVFKEKVNFFLIGRDSAVAEKVSGKRSKSADFPENYLSYDDQQFSLPSSLLKPEYEEEGDDFSVHFGSSSGEKKMSFTIKEGPVDENS